MSTTQPFAINGDTNTLMIKLSESAVPELIPLVDQWNVTIWDDDPHVYVCVTDQFGERWTP